MQQRQRGAHPAKVWVIYGRDCWRRQPTDAPVLCVPDDYRPGRYDWSLLAGVPAHVVYRDGEFLHALAAEVAMFAAPVWVHWCGPDGFIGADWVHQETVDEFLTFDQHRPDVAACWTPESETDYRVRELAWYAAAVEDCLSHGERQTAA